MGRREYSAGGIIGISQWSERYNSEGEIFRSLGGNFPHKGKQLVLGGSFLICIRPGKQGVLSRTVLHEIITVF